MNARPHTITIKHLVYAGSGFQADGSFDAVLAIDGPAYSPLRHDRFCPAAVRVSSDKGVASSGTIAGTLTRKDTKLFIIRPGTKQCDTYFSQQAMKHFIDSIAQAQLRLLSILTFASKRSWQLSLTAILETIMQPKRHFLQTNHWGAFQSALKRKVIDEKGDGWRALGIIERGRYGTRLYSPYGPTATTRGALRQSLEALTEIAAEQQALFVRIEPVAPVSTEDMRRFGAIWAPGEIQPAHTWRIDLTQSEEAIIAAMRATNRNLHRTAAKKGITFRQSDDPKDMRILLQFIHEVAERTSIRPHPDSYFMLQARTLMARQAAHLFFADYDGRPIASAFVYDSDTTRYYAHAGAAYNYRKLHASTPLVTYMMLDAKKAGLKTFDFYGIAPPDQPHHAWSGFTEFKKSFGGEAHDYLGTWDIPLKPLPYRLYRSAQAVAARVKK